MRSLLFFLLMFCVVNYAAAQGFMSDPAKAPQTKTSDAENGSNKLLLFDSLKNNTVWRSYKARFVADTGRIVDTGNKNISHSEGQGYGMVLALAANDQDAFQRIWDWTRSNLMVRDEDSLFAWRWEPGRRPGVADLHDASDGDILIAWALSEASDVWNEPSYKFAARRIASDIGRRLILFKTDNGPLLLPGMNGFSAEDRSDGPVINLSYWVFPALVALQSTAPDVDWLALNNQGLNLLQKAQFGPAKLPSEWISVSKQTLTPAAGFQPVFSYNGIRIPLYLVWSGHTEEKFVRPFTDLWSKKDHSGLPIVDVGNGLTIDWLNEPGYGAIAELVNCATTGATLPSSFSMPSDSENYYPATLHLLSIIAAQMRYPTCLGH